jgi:hypothetical protein
MENLGGLDFDVLIYTIINLFVGLLKKDGNFMYCGLL